MKRSPKRRTLCITIAGLLGMAGSMSPAIAQYPERPIKIVVPFAAGGPADSLGRQLAQGLASRLKTSVIVENKPGAGGNIGTAQVASAAADGYTLLLGYIGPLAINPALYQAQPFDPVEDFSAITMLASNPLVLVTRPGLGANDVGELIKLANSRQKSLSYSSGGVGSANHLAAELFKSAANIKLLHVPYKGAAPATTALVGGEVDLMLNGVSVALPFIQAGRIKALAVTTKTRLPSLPQVMTMEEAGIRPFDVSAWFGLLAPKNTPADVLQVLHRAAQDTMKSAEVSEQLKSAGLELRLSSPAEFSQFIRDELKTWSRIVTESGARAG